MELQNLKKYTERMTLLSIAFWHKGGEYCSQILLQTDQSNNSICDWNILESAIVEWHNMDGH